MHSGGTRGRASVGWVGAGLVYSFASALTGGVAGTVLGVVGARLAVELRFACASLLAAAAIILGGLELGGWRVRPVQCDRETPQRWVADGPLRWALRNGGMLGLGATSRIGFWLWYVVPATALLGAQPALGGAIYGLYGLVRGGTVWILLLALSRSEGRVPLELWLLDHTAEARVVAAGQLVIIGIVLALTLGF